MSADRFSKNLWYLIAKLKTSSFPQIARFQFFAWKLDKMTWHIAQERALGGKISHPNVLCVKVWFEALWRKDCQHCHCVWYAERTGLMCGFRNWFREEKILGSWNVQNSETKPTCLGPASNIQNSRFSSIYSFLWRQHTCALTLSGPCFSIWLYRKNTDQAPALRLPQHNRLLPSHATMSCKIPPSRLSVGFS